MNQSIYIPDTQVANQFGVSRATIWRWVQTGNFPKPIKLSPGCSRWKIEDVQKWAESRGREV
jgi:prophage regulatory protein